MLADRVSRLSDGQEVCLRLVLQHMTSKDIARSLGISPHTVDKRLKEAMRILGVGSRVEAARMLYASQSDAMYQPLVCQSPDVEPSPFSGWCGDAASMPRSDVPERAALEDEERVSFLVHPFPGFRAADPPEETPRRHNALSPVARVGAIVAIAIGSALSFGAILGGLDALAELVTR